MNVAESEPKKKSLLKNIIRIGPFAIPIWLLLVCCLCPVPVMLFTPGSSDEPPLTSAPQSTTAVPPELTSTVLPTNVPSSTNTPQPTTTQVPPTHTPTSTSTPEPTATLEPTATPGPTETPLPTDTPRPTHTPRPTSTPGLTTEEKTYQLEVLSITSEYGDAFTEFSSLATQAGENPILLLDEDWQLANAVVLFTMMSLNEEIRELDVPDKFAVVQGHLVDASDHYDAFVLLYAEGVDEIDAAKLDSAMAELTLGNEDLSLASEAIEAIAQ